ncbi:MAG TPA: cell envelope integrity protein TolA, partial [Methyloradius sp.]
AGPVSPTPNPSSQGEIDKYVSLISSKIHRYVNNQLCGNGKPELVIGLELMPTGEVVGAPRIIKSSGIIACDDAVIRAILLAQPLPLPTQPDLLAQFRSLNLKFTPND